MFFLTLGGTGTAARRPLRPLPGPCPTAWPPPSEASPACAGRMALVPSWQEAEDRILASTLAYISASITALWGVAHAIPTAAVIRGFEPMSNDNRRVLVQEWLAEAFTMWGLALLVVVVTAVGRGSDAAVASYGVAAGLLVALAVLTSFTGSRTRVVWFRVCPILLTFSALLLVGAAVV